MQYNCKQNFNLIELFDFAMLQDHPQSTRAYVYVVKRFLMFELLLIHHSLSQQVFSLAKAYFSIGGQYYNGEPVHFAYMPDPIMEHARDVTIKLHHRIGRFVQLQLYFASKWIMLSEVSFISGEFAA